MKFLEINTPHYDGLYDQSIYFDQAMGQYFLQKGWAIRQFSMLRSMSELLIQKVLVERYPHLQTSCHSAHKRDERVYPCGQCEKCRRIVGMLLALDADSRKCGYGENQIISAIDDLFKKGVHQESVGGEHLCHLLFEKGYPCGSKKS